MNKNVFRIFGLFMSIICIAFNAQAQLTNTVTGKIFDAETKEPLPGATVRIENTIKGTTTNINGGFRLSNIGAEKVTLVISYISYSEQKIALDFSGNKTQNITVKMTPASAELDAVEITAKSEGQVQAMLEQKKAINIKNVISYEQIQQFPDMNAAEAMSRIPGITLQRDQGEGKYVQLRGTPPALTNFNINGEQIPSPEGGVRYVGMDIISADQVDFIEVSKVLTPDMDADGIGGTVNIITKKASSKKPEVNATLSGGYNNLRETANYQGQLSYGQRFGKFGVFVNGSYYVNNQGSDNMEFDYTKGPFWGSTADGLDNYHVQYSEVQLRHYDITRKRLGLSSTLDYEFNKKHSIYLRGMYNRFTDNELRRRLIYTLDDGINFDHYLYGDVERDIKQRQKNQQVSTVNFGGRNDLNFLIFTYEAAYSLASEETPDRLEVVFDSPGHGIDMQFDHSDPDWPRVSFDKQLGYEHAHNYEEYELDEMLFDTSETRDHNTTLKANFQIPYQFGKYHKGFIKFGGKARLKNKTRDVNTTIYGNYFTRSLYDDDTTETLNLLVVGDDFVDYNLLNQGYTMEYFPSPEKILAFYDRNSHHFIYSNSDSKINTFAEDYSASEKIYALYGMVKHDINKLMLMGGFRYERTDIHYTGNKIITNRRGNYITHDTLEDKRTHEFFLPQFQAKYTINNNFNLRTGVTYTYSRPNFDYVLPYREEDRDDVKYGNPDLKFPQSDRKSVV
jgi:TonB-dependent receptor